MSITIDVTEELRRRAEARRDAREIRMLAEIANLHKTIEDMRKLCDDALFDCMLKNSIQAKALRRAIALAEQTLKGDP